VRDDAGARRRGGADIADHVTAGARTASLCNRFISADVIAVHVGADHIADLRVGD